MREKKTVYLIPELTTTKLYSYAWRFFFRRGAVFTGLQGRHFALAASIIPWATALATPQRSQGPPDGAGGNAVAEGDVRQRPAAVQAEAAVEAGRPELGKRAAPGLHPCGEAER